MAQTPSASPSVDRESSFLASRQVLLYGAVFCDPLVQIVQRINAPALDDPILVNEYFGPTKATDHNLYIKGDLMYQANYQAGFRLVDISDRENPKEIGYFDTTPYEGNPPTMGGAFSVYPFFESGTVIVTSSREGLFILRPARQTVF